MQEMVRGGNGVSTSLSNPLFDMWIKGAETWMKTWQAYQAETARFLTKRFNADLELMRSLTHCSDLQAMTRCQQQWSKEQSKDYAEEMARIAGTTFDLASDGLAGLDSLVQQGSGTPNAKP